MQLATISLTSGATWLYLVGMLTDPFELQRDVMSDMMAAMGGNSPEPQRIQKGIYQIGHHSSDIVLYGHNGDWKRITFDGVPVYGVCDSPEQFLKLHGAALEACPNRVAVFFTHVAKDPNNKGQGDGWRWHKWGEYIGEGSPQHEHLDDEDAFPDGIYCFHIHDIDWKPSK